jgi:capsular polysaccharide transport system permease protein
MVRAGVFGEFVETHYNPVYPLAWAGGLIFLGLLLLSVVRNHIDVE